MDDKLLILAVAACIGLPLLTHKVIKSRKIIGEQDLKAISNAETKRARKLNKRKGN
jgi:hypothetical protein